MIYYTADLHFGHTNVIKFDNRPFSDVDEMDRYLIDVWNLRVKDDDHVYIVGDVCLNNSLPIEKYLVQLKGHKHLIKGNHDGKLLKNEKAMECFESVDDILQISDEGRRVTMCHYPLAEWPGYYKEGWHIYGHIHNNKKETFHIMKNLHRALNAGVAINNYMPVSFEELIKNNERFKAEDEGENETLSNNTEIKLKDMCLATRTSKLAAAVEALIEYGIEDDRSIDAIAKYITNKYPNILKEDVTDMYLSKLRKRN